MIREAKSSGVGACGDELLAATNPATASPSRKSLNSALGRDDAFAGHASRQIFLAASLVLVLVLVPGRSSAPLPRSATVADLPSWLRRPALSNAHEATADTSSMLS